MKRLILFFFTLILFVQCSSDRVPDGVLAKDQMISLVTDIQLIDGYVANLPTDSSYKVAAGLYLSAFKKYNTDSAEFNRSLKFYSLKPEKLNEIYNEVKTQLDTLQKVDERRLQAEAKRAERESLRKEKRFRDSIAKQQKKGLADSLPKPIRHRPWGKSMPLQQLKTE